jgi:hypothetical protein
VTDITTLEELLDRQNILGALTRISRGVDRFDRDMFLSGYHEDAVIDAGAFVAPAAQVYDAGAALHEAGQSATQHYLMNHSCELDGDVAHAETYYQYVGVNRDGTNWVAGGRYLDRLQRRDGAWRVAFRYTVLEWSGTIEPNTVPLFEGVGDLHLNGLPSRGRQDPSYRRPLVNRRNVTMPHDPRALSTPHS